MKAFLSTLAISGILAWFCYAQDNLSGAVKPSASDNASSGPPNADLAAYYATLNLRVVEFRAQSALLSQLAQEHTKRAVETPRDQDARAQWERKLAKELGDKSLALVGLLNNTRKERLAFEQTHPDLVVSVLPNSLAGATTTPNPDEIAFMEKLEERLAAAQQEIADTIEAGKVYTAQLQTNTVSYGFSKVASLLQDNGNTVKQLQKQVSDLELKKLEFRAWTSRGGLVRLGGQ
jgi:hypothetical protein